MKYILLFLCILSLSCKYNVTNPVGTLRDYTAGSGIIYYVSSSAHSTEIADALRKNKHSLGKYKIVVTNSGNSDNILSNITYVLTNNTYSFSNVEVDISKLTNLFEITNGAFSNAANLKSIMLSDNVSNIGKNAFSGCSSLSDIRFSNGLTNISEGAFSNCVSLTLVMLSSEEEMAIEKNAFTGCSNLVNLVLPKNLKSVDNEAFKYCNQLKNVEYLGTDCQSSSCKSDCKLDCKSNCTSTNSNCESNCKAYICKLSNCKPFSSTPKPSNLYLPNTSKTSDFSNFLGGSWTIYTNHIPN